MGSIGEREWLLNVACKIFLFVIVFIINGSFSRLLNAEVAHPTEDLRLSCRREFTREYRSSRKEETTSFNESLLAEAAVVILSTRSL